MRCVTTEEGVPVDAAITYIIPRPWSSISALMASFHAVDTSYLLLVASLPTT